MCDKNDKEFYGKKRTRNESSYKKNIIKKAKNEVSVSIVGIVFIFNCLL